MGTALVEEIVDILYSGLTSGATAFGAGISAMAEGIFLTKTTVEGVTTTSLSTFGTLIIVFAAISLVISLGRLITRWVSSIGSARV